MTYRFLSGAQRDLADAMEYYEGSMPGLGFEFLEEVGKRHAKHHSIGVDGGVVDFDYDIYDGAREIRQPELRSSEPSSSWPGAGRAGSASWSSAVG